MLLYLEYLWYEMFAYNRRLPIHMLIGALVGTACFGFKLDLVTALIIAFTIAVLVESIQSIKWGTSILDSIGDVIATVIMAALTAWKGF